MLRYYNYHFHQHCHHYFHYYYHYYHHCHYQVLPLTKHHPVHQLVNWCEVFPTRQSLSQSAPITEGDTEARVFLLVVGLGHQVSHYHHYHYHYNYHHQVLGVLLETGGCAALHGAVVRPDPFYVDQVLS